MITLSYHRSHKFFSFFLLRNSKPEMVFFFGYLNNLEKFDDEQNEKHFVARGGGRKGNKKNGRHVY